MGGRWSAAAVALIARKTSLIRLLFPCLFSCFPAGIWAYENASEHWFSTAFGWSRTEPILTNITPFIWLRAEEIDHPQVGVEQALEAIARIPEGRRAMITVDLLTSLHRHPRDLLRDRSGKPVECVDENDEVGRFPSIWWEHGAETVRKITEAWFRRFAERGGKVDYLILDYEEDSSYSHLYHRLPDPGGRCGIAAYLKALKADPRFPMLDDRLQGRDVMQMLAWDRNDTWLLWRDAAKELTAGYIEQAVFEPVRAIFPQIAFSNYGFYAQTPGFGLPNRFGHLLHRHGPGRHVGTHQSAALYGWVGIEGPVSLADGASLAATPFNALRMDVNIMRAQRFSSRAPILPWIAYKGFAESLLRDNDLYQELIYHVLLSGAEALLYWNPRSIEPPATKAEDRLVSRLMGRVDRLCDNRRPELSDSRLASWSAAYLITQARAGGRDIWRFTPDPGRGLKPTDYIVSEDPLVLEIDGESLRFPFAEVVRFEQPLSAAGVWIVAQDADWPGL